LGPRLTHEFDLLGSRDVIGHVTISFHVGHFPIGGPLKPLSLTVSEMFNGECDSDAMVEVDMTLNDL